jgi:hypothetical protein
VAFERLDDAPDELGVVLVERPIELPTTPSNVDLRPGVECRKDLPEGSQGELVEVAALNSRNRCLGYATRAPKVRLPPAAATTKSANYEPEAPVVHSGILPDIAYPGRISLESCALAVGVPRALAVGVPRALAVGVLAD